MSLENTIKRLKQKEYIEQLIKEGNLLTEFYFEQLKMFD